MRQAFVDPTVTRSTIRADVGVAIVPQTISRHLAEANLKSKRPFRALPLTPEHRQLRLHWCQVRLMWNVTDWQNVVFTDESRFVLGTDDNRVRVRRRPGTIFQQDNARPHTARVAQDFLRHFQTLPWPACSPNLSPVEHLWDQLKRQMPSCHSVHDLELTVQDLWAHLLQNDIRRGHNATETFAKLQQEGRESIEDEPRSGRSSVSKTAENVVRVRDLVRLDRRLTVRMIGEELNLNHTSVHQILTNELKMRKICAKMVPKNLSQ
ncbi:transposable element Tc1 transposase [Trichonephila clavipes]|nr:transposable element Tc1 transposase [Trichonephila clavipes]